MFGLVRVHDSLPSSLTHQWDGRLIEQYDIVSGMSTTHNVCITVLDFSKGHLHCVVYEEARDPSKLHIAELMSWLIFGTSCGVKDTVHIVAEGNNCYMKTKGHLAQLAEGTGGVVRPSIRTCLPVEHIMPV